MKISEMAEILTVAFVGSWPTFKVTEPTAKLWADSFEGMDPDTFWKAIHAALKTHTGNFPPTIGQVHAVMEDLRNLGEMTEGEAWGLLIEAVRRFGFYQPVEARKFIQKHGGDRMVEVVRCMGWSEVCCWNVADEAANRAHFWRMLQGFKKREDFKAKVIDRPRLDKPESAGEIAQAVLKTLEAK